MKKGESCGVEIKEKILKIAFKLFLERGFLEVSINQLIKEVGMTKKCFYNYFESKHQLICEAVEKFLFPRFEDIILIADEHNEVPKKKLLKIFQKYSETESYLKNNFNIDKINYRLITFLTVEGIEKYQLMTKHIVDFHNRLLEKIESVIEEGKRLGQISSTVVSKSTAMYTISSLQSSIVLWVMNQNIDIKDLFETSFMYLWNSIKSLEKKL